MAVRVAAADARDGAARAVHALPGSRELWHSFYSTPKGARGAVFVGVDNYRALIDDPIFWQALGNNLWYALGTIPLSIVLALAMAVWVNDRIPGRGLLRLAYFTPTILPMIAVANIWLFFYTPEYGLLEQVTGLFGAPASQLARQQVARR
jgi:sn-glycerol 3-phosphate transport system permease protein